MEWPKPILVGSMLFDCKVLDMSPEEPNKVWLLGWEKGAECKRYRFLSGGGKGEQRLYRHLFPNPGPRDFISNTHPPLSHIQAKYTWVASDHLDWTVSEQGKKQTTWYTMSCSHVNGVWQNLSWIISYLKIYIFHLGPWPIGTCLLKVHESFLTVRSIYFTSHSWSSIFSITQCRQTVPCTNSNLQT